LAAANLAAMQAAGETSAPAARSDGEGRRERGERPRRERQAPDLSGSEAAAPADGQEATPEAGEVRQPRERRSRDRYGRDRRERGDSPEAASAVSVEGASSEVAAQAAPTAEQAAPVAMSATEPIGTVPQAASPVPAGLPKVQPYQLPLHDLVQVASSSGLQWVNSDADKIAQAQAAIAAEPKPVHVPRERPPVVQIDQGPLILVETRRDLRNMELPFESSTTKA
jgi:ribonuclease E